MATYIAHYRSPNSGAERAMGTFEFESESRAGSKQNMHDARITMLEQFGSVAVPYIITATEQKKAGNADLTDGQLELDFRDPIKQTRVKRTFERGKI